MFGYITRGFPRILGYVLQVIKYSISVPLDRGGFGGWNADHSVKDIEQKNSLFFLLDQLSIVVTMFIFSLLVCNRILYIASPRAYKS